MDTKMAKMKVLFLTLVISSSLAFSQNGPVLPQCPQCLATGLETLPHNGLWWSPDLSGVGVGIEIQGEKVLGTYYGYNQDGQATWYTFVGNLLPSDDPQVMWDVQSHINLFENGVCFNCQYQTPGMADFSGSIHIQFNQANHAHISINDGEVQNIVPFIFAENTNATFSEITDFEVPEMTGTWVFAEAILPVHEFNPIKAEALILYPQFVRNFDDGTKELSVRGRATDVVIPVLTCKTYLDENNNIAGPTCVLFGTVNDDGSSDNGYYVNLAGLGVNKIKGRKANGDTIEAFKMEFGGN